MKKSLLLKAATASVIALCFTACGESSSNKKEDSLSYSFSVNGCATGKKTFSDLNSYCQSLLDDAANNYCAQDIRSKTYAERCDSVNPNANRAADELDQPEQSGDENSTVEAQGETLPEAQVETQPAPPTEIPETEAPVQPSAPEASAKKPSTTLPQEITIVAHPEKTFIPTPQQVGTDMMTTLSTTLIVDSVEPATDKIWNLGFAESWTILEDIGHCDISNQSIGEYSTGGKIPFTIIGVDEAKALDMNSCLTKLANLALTGFTVEFKNVPRRGGLELQTIPKVTLKIKTR